MPLPKTATIAARATEVYCEAWSVILQRISRMPPTRESDLNDLSQLLPYLRQLLTCCACAGLLDNAMISLTCGHCYCFECQFREPLLKIQCRQCRERTGLVMESQLQLIVNCYKRMCQIIGEELRRNPCALDVTSDKDEEPQAVSATAETKLNISVKLPSEGQEECGKASIMSEKEVIALSKKTAVTVGDPKKKITVTVEDPIGEIVREVEKGTKVSRAILWIKPPHKYLNSKVPVTPRVVTKKDTPTPANAPVNKTLKKEAPVKCEGGQCPNAEAQQSSAEPVSSASPEAGAATRKRKGKLTQGEVCKKNTAHKEEHVASVIASAKRKLRKPAMTAALSLHRNQSNMARRKRVVERTERKESSKQPVPKASTKKVATTEKKAVESDANHETDANRENKPATGDVCEVSAVPHQGPMHFLCGGELKVSGLSISVHCFNNAYLKTTSRSLALLSHAQPGNVLADALSHSTPGAAKKMTSFASGEWLKLIRQRKWDLLCPSVVAKRSMEVVAKTLVLQCKAAKAKKKFRYHRGKHRKLTPEQLAKKSSASAKPRSPKPGPPPPPTAAFHPSRPIPTPSPFAHSRPLMGDIPLPDNIPILPNEALLEDDINWKELSDFLESNDEESMSALPPPITQYGPPPRPQQPHPQPIDPIHFDEHHRFGPRHLMHPPYIHHHPGHLHIPPPHLHPPPPPGPHTPMMSPFTPDMRPPDLPPPPDGYYSPMMGPEDFIPPRGMGPDGGGYSSPMTPQRGYPPPSVMCPMEFQHSPGHPHHHHHHGGHFPMPSPRMRFPPPPPPPRRSFPGPPQLPPPKKPKGSRNSNGSMSKMVSKMKMKTPSAPKQKKLLSPATPTGEQQPGKKRRSPGYSEAGWRCRCGTNNVMFPNKVCAKGKCPCYTKGVACKNCLCRHCHNPFGTREVGASTREVNTPDTQDVDAGTQEVSTDTQEVNVDAQDGSSGTREASESSPADTIASE